MAAEDGVEQSRRDLVRVRVLAFRVLTLRRDHFRQPIEELLHRRRQRRLELVECSPDVAEQVRAREALDQRPLKYSAASSENVRPLRASAPSAFGSMRQNFVPLIVSS